MMASPQRNNFGGLSSFYQTVSTGANEVFGFGGSNRNKNNGKNQNAVAQQYRQPEENHCARLVRYLNAEDWERLGKPREFIWCSPLGSYLNYITPALFRQFLHTNHREFPSTKIVEDLVYDLFGDDPTKTYTTIPDFIELIIEKAQEGKSNKSKSGSKNA